jgi:hypothetical protein
MWHSIKYIGTKREEITNRLNDKIKFSTDDFFNYAKNNKEKYKIIDSGDDLQISTWYVDDLIKDYKAISLESIQQS